MRRSSSDRAVIRRRFQLFLDERYCVTFGLWHETSVCCLSVCLSVTLLHPRQRLELFGYIFAPPISSGTRTVCVTILGKNFKASRGRCKLNIRGYEILAFFDQYIALFRKCKDIAIVTMEEECDLSYVIYVCDSYVIYRMVLFPMALSGPS